MICTRCRDEGQRSIVRGFAPEDDAPIGELADRYWDEDGEGHSHDPNSTRVGFRCSNGHRWIVEWWSPCWAPGCDWPTRDEETTFIEPESVEV